MQLLRRRQWKRRGQQPRSGAVVGSGSGKGSHGTRVPLPATAAVGAGAMGCCSSRRGATSASMAAATSRTGRGLFDGEADYSSANAVEGRVVRSVALLRGRSSCPDLSLPLFFCGGTRGLFFFVLGPSRRRAARLFLVRRGRSPPHGRETATARATDKHLPAASTTDEERWGVVIRRSVVSLAESSPIRMMPLLLLPTTATADNRRHRASRR